MPGFTLTKVTDQMEPSLKGLSCAKPACAKSINTIVLHSATNFIGFSLES